MAKMDNNKGAKGAPGGLLQSGKGLGSYSDNPMSAASRTAPKCGPGMNSDQTKANGLLQKAHAERESLRGKSGM